MYRSKLTDEEWNAVSHLTSAIKVDDIFDISEKSQNEDYFWDMEADQPMSLKEGLTDLCEALAYPLAHEGLTEKESTLVANLFKEFDVEEDTDWLLRPSPDEAVQTTGRFERSPAETIDIAIVVKDGLLTDVYASSPNVDVSYIDMDTQDPEEQDEAESRISDILKDVNDEKMFAVW